MRAIDIFYKWIESQRKILNGEKLTDDEEDALLKYQERLKNELITPSFEYVIEALEKFFKKEIEFNIAGENEFTFLANGKRIEICRGNKKIVEIYYSIPPQLGIIVHRFYENK